MTQTKEFIKLLIRSVFENELIPISNELTYKLLISFFPFLIFLMSVLGFLNIDYDFILYSLNSNMPTEIMQIINVFFDEVIFNKSLSLLSSSLILSIYTSSSGFYSIMRGLNKAYDKRDERNFIIVKLISIMLVILFAAMLIMLLILFIFVDTILKALLKNDVLNKVPESIFSFTGYLLFIVFLVLIIMIIYKLSLSVRVSLLECCPGAVFAVMFFILSSRVFNIYINNFSRFSKIYGSIGGVFILIFWINLISFVLLMGGQINAAISKISEPYLGAPNNK